MNPMEMFKQTKDKPNKRTMNEEFGYKNLEEIYDAIYELNRLLPDSKMMPDGIEPKKLYPNDVILSTHITVNKTKCRLTVRYSTFHICGDFDTDITAWQLIEL